MQVIKNLQIYPDIKKFWKNIVEIGSDKYKYAIERELRKALFRLLRKGYFYLIIPESLPLLDSLLLDERTPCGESIIQASAAVEAILKKEYRLWKNEIEDTGISPKYKRKEMLRRVTSGCSLDQKFNDSIGEVFDWRDDCAHGKAHRYRKEDALESMSRVLSFIRDYLNFKKNQTFPSGRANND